MGRRKRDRKSLAGAPPAAAGADNGRERGRFSARRKTETILRGTRKSRTLTTLRDTLLPKLISGELRVNDAEKFIEGVV